jgi:hypothetical protein
MSYESIKENARTRFNEVQINLNYIANIEMNNSELELPSEVKIMKGLFYVHLYSALEKTVNDVVEHTLRLISSSAVKYNHYSVPFSVISLADHLKSFKDCGHSRFFDKAITIFSNMQDKSIASINETVFSGSLKNVWTKTIDEVMRAFGMNGFIASPRERATLDEIVEKRNAVAHGRESALEVGERHRTEVLRDKTLIITEVAYRLIDDFESYYESKKYIKPVAKRYYS